MPQPFTWVPDVARGEWLRPAEATCFDRVEDMAAMLETERATWATAAASFGTTMHAQAQFPRLVRRDHGSSAGAISADGWRYGDTQEGCIDAASLTAAAAVLARHTATPDAGIAAIWEGWGGLVSSAGVAYLVCESNEGLPDPSTGETAAHTGDPEPGSGQLAREVATGPRFELHGDAGRRYVPFEAGANDFEDPAWPDRAPWVDEVMWAQLPSILWPEDHSWVLATEIDFDSTLVAGSSALIRELVQAPGLEAFPLRPDADLSWDGDVPNRPE